MLVIVVAQDEWSPKPEVAQDRFYCITLLFTPFPTQIDYYMLILCFENCVVLYFNNYVFHPMLMMEIKVPLLPNKTSRVE